MCASINQQAVNFKGRTLPALPKHGQTQNAAVAANRRDKWERGIYSAAAVRCQGSGGMNSALPKNPRCALRHPGAWHFRWGFPMSLSERIQFGLDECRRALARAGRWLPPLVLAIDGRLKNSIIPH